MSTATLSEQPDEQTDDATGTWPLRCRQTEEVGVDRRRAPARPRARSSVVATRTTVASRGVRSRSTSRAATSSGQGRRRLARRRRRRGRAALVDGRPRIVACRRVVARPRRAGTAGAVEGRPVGPGGPRSTRCGTPGSRCPGQSMPAQPSASAAQERSPDHGRASPAQKSIADWYSEHRPRAEQRAPRRRRCRGQLLGLVARPREQAGVQDRLVQADAGVADGQDPARSRRRRRRRRRRSSSAVVVTGGSLTDVVSPVIGVVVLVEVSSRASAPLPQPIVATTRATKASERPSTA